jgi:hypothetical protein
MQFYYSIIAAYWISAIILIIYLILRRKHLLFRKISAYLLFTSVFFYYLIWIPQGLEITDEGWALTKSWFLLHGSWKDNVDVYWGSTLINGLWLSILNTPCVLWERIGFSLLVAGMGVFVFLILKNIFWSDYLVIILFLLSIIWHRGTYTMNYSNLPVFFVLGSIYFLLSVENTVKIFNYFMAGIFIIIAIFCKFTFVLILSIPIAFIIFHVYFSKKQEINIKRISIFLISGLIIGLISG